MLVRHLELTGFYYFLVLCWMHMIIDHGVHDKVLLGKVDIISSVLLEQILNERMGASEIFLGYIHTYTDTQSVLFIHWYSYTRLNLSTTSRCVNNILPVELLRKFTRSNVDQPSQWSLTYSGRINTFLSFRCMYCIIHSIVLCNNIYYSRICIYKHNRCITCSQEW